VTTPALLERQLWVSEPMTATSLIDTNFATVPIKPKKLRPGVYAICFQCVDVVLWRNLDRHEKSRRHLSNERLETR
jgi:hypothetical protein